MNHTSTIIGILVLTGKITAAEADRLQIALLGEQIPKEWSQWVKQIEKFIGRKVLK